MAKQNYYQFFGLKDFEDDQLEIKKSYRSMALKWHPDRHTDPKDKPHAEHMMKQVVEVYRILSKHKDEYDQHIGRRHAQSSRSRQQKSSAYGFDFDFSMGEADKEQMEEAMKSFYEKMHEQKGSNWYGAYTNGDFGTSTREEARKKDWEPNDHPRGNRRVGETSIFSQNQAVEIVKTWTWDEFTDAKNFINKLREKRKNGFA